MGHHGTSSQNEFSDHIKAKKRRIPSFLVFIRGKGPQGHPETAQKSPKNPKNPQKSPKMTFFQLQVSAMVHRDSLGAFQSFKTVKSVNSSQNQSIFPNFQKLGFFGENLFDFFLPSISWPGDYFSPLQLFSTSTLVNFTGGALEGLKLGLKWP